MKTKIMTVDLEPDLRSQHCKSIELVLPKLLNFFDDHNIKATFFTVTSLLPKYESEIKELTKKHEIASHSHTHSWLTEQNAEFEIQQSRQTLKEYNIPCHGFRAPKFITTKDHLTLLKKHGYQYDSSQTTLFPSRFQAHNQNQFTQFKFPVINSGLSYLKLLHPFSKIFPQPQMFYLHPWEFLEKNQLPKSDSLTKTLLRHNAGRKAQKIFQEFIKKQPSKWISCQDWINQSKNNSD